MLAGLIASGACALKLEGERTMSAYPESNDGKIFPPTTPRSSNIGQPGYDSNEHWQHFLDKYRAKILQFGRRHYAHRLDMVEDVFEDMVAKILTNPSVTSREPSVRFRTVLVRLYRNTFADAVRNLKENSHDNYLANTLPFRSTVTTQECDRRRLQLLAIDLIQRDLMRPDYENGRFAKEFRPSDLTTWRYLQEEDTTYVTVASQMKLSLWKVFAANRRVQQRIRLDAEALLTSLGLL